MSSLATKFTIALLLGAMIAIGSVAGQGTTSMGYWPFECGAKVKIDCFYPAVCAHRGDKTMEACLGMIGTCNANRCDLSIYECVNDKYCLPKAKSK